MRVIAVEPETSQALHAALEAGHPVPLEPSSIADGLNAPFARRACRSSSAATSSACSSPRTRSRTRSASSTSARSSPVEPAGAAAAAALLAGKVEARQPGRRRQRRQRGRRNHLWYPGFAMKAEIHPEYVLATVHCSCGNSFVDPLDEARAERRDLRAVPPVLHGQAEARRHGRPRRALPAAAREGRPRRARHGRRLPTSDGAGDRRPGRPRGRDDARTAQLGGRRAQARRRDRPGRPRDRPADGAPLGAAPAGRPRRRRARRVASRSASARSRSPRTTPRRRRPRATRSPPRSAAGRSSSRSRSRSASRVMLFKVSPALLTDLLPISSGGWFVIVEGLIRVTDLRRLPERCSA